LGVGFRYDALLWPRLDGAEGAGAYRLSLEEMGALDRDDPARQTAWADAARRGDGRLMRSDMVYGCGAGYRSFHVDCAGRLSPCLMTRRLSYDLLGGAFDAGWDLMGEAIATRRQRDVPCRSCAVGELCQQCVGWSQAVHGDDETPVDYVCAVGRQRADQVSSGDARARR
jgi:radical SAM protein with 4Fe4S-binding SPASM domain